MPGVSQVGSQLGEVSQAEGLLRLPPPAQVKGTLGRGCLGHDTRVPLQARPAVAGMEASGAEHAKGEHFHTVTPLLESWALSQVAGMTVFLKCENVQPAGSFKIRGIGHFCREVRVCGRQGGEG